MGGLQNFVEGEVGGVGRIFREGEVGGVFVLVHDEVADAAAAAVADDDDVVSVTWLSRGECCRKEDANKPTKAVNSKIRCLGVLN